MDNRVFNVNGRGEDMLLATIKLACAQSQHTKIEGWQILPDKGFVLYWSSDDKVNKFPVPLSPEQVTPIIIAWLASDESRTITSDCHWDSDMDHDGHNTLGWRVYTEDWGHIGHSWRGFLAVRLAYMWHGK